MIKAMTKFITVPLRNSQQEQCLSRYVAIAYICIVADLEILKGGFCWEYVDPRCRGLGAQPPTANKGLI